MKDLNKTIEYEERDTGLGLGWSGRESGQALKLPPLAKKHLYRSRQGMIFGVCRGLADYSELSVFWIRVILVGLTLLSWILPFVILYMVAAFLMKPEPNLDEKAQKEWREYTSYACDQSAALARLKRELDDLEHQTLRLDRLTHARQFDWEQRLKSGG
jgi:phage shock protein C